jgi:hypothetical protein
VALVDLSQSRVWLFRHGKLAKIAQQKSDGRYHFYMYLQDVVKTRKRAKVKDLTTSSLKNR